MEEQNNPIIYYLTDEIIDQYAEDTLTEYRDINLKYKRWSEPWRNGPLDPLIFGSLFQDHCNCGAVKEVGKRCNICKAIVYDDISSLSRYAKIELPVYYCTSIKFKKFFKFISTNYKIEYNLSSGLIDLGDKATIFNLCQFDWDSEAEKIVVTDEITDYTRCSYEGLQTIVLRTKPELMPDFMNFINRKIIVLPIRMRPSQFVYSGGTRRLAMHEITVVYQNIIYAVEKFYKGMEGDLKEQHHIALLRGALRLFVTKAMEGLSNLMKSSKQNLARTMQSDRLENSGRCTIIPGPNLKIDEVEIPTALFYEACREEFTNFIQTEFNVSKDRAEHLVRYEANSKEIQEAFSLYVEGNGTPQYPGKYVIINRAPTLHEYNLMAMKVHLTKANTMSIPIAVCKPFNADFDGDTMAWYALSDKVAPIVVEAMSPKSMLFYKSDHAPIFLPTQEVMQGLILATKTRRPAEILEFDSSIEEIEKYRLENKRTFKYQTVIHYQGKETTLARLILGTYFNIDLNDYLGGMDKNLTSKNIPKLYDNISELEDRIERIRNIQVFALKIVTIAGITSLSLEELYSDLGDSALKEMKEVEESETLSTKEKSVKIRQLYRSYIERAQSTISEEVMQQVTESSRVKTSQLTSLLFPLMTTSIKGEISIGTSTLANGMSQVDYERLAIENRGTQDIKVDNVPGGGYFTRQMVYLAASYTYRDAYDPENPGIFIKKKRAAGRTTLEGEIVPVNSSEELIKVRSLVTTRQNRAVITKDLISNKIKYQDYANIGISLITSLSASLTQGMLALKHGGNLFNLEPDNGLSAGVDIDRVELLEQFIILYSKDQKFVLPRPSNWVTNFSTTGGYKKGEIIGYAYHPVTPSYKLDCFIALSKARKVRASKQFEKNKIEFSACYALEEGVIKYKRNPDGELEIVIGDKVYPYNPESLYFLPEGTKVKKFERFCSGLIDLDFYLRNSREVEEGYYFFREQMYEMTSGLVDELIEFFFRLIVKKNRQGQLINKGVINAIHESNSFFTEVAFEDYKKAFNKLEPTGTELVDDLFGRSNLPLLLNSHLALSAEETYNIDRK